MRHFAAGGGRIWTTIHRARISPVTRISLLDAIPDLELIRYLPAYLGWLLTLLWDPRADLRAAAGNVLGELLREIGELVLSAVIAVWPLLRTRHVCAGAAGGGLCPGPTSPGTRRRCGCVTRAWTWPRS